MSVVDLKFSDDADVPDALYESAALTGGGRAAFELETAEHRPRGARRRRERRGWGGMH